ncbi:MAG: hypothetical protein AD742_01065 [Methylibium sp. NZG]|nr:MAG: hypothetical protein AD742_01065 [Methylibium sp. NZG]
MIRGHLSLGEARGRLPARLGRAGSGKVGAGAVASRTARFALSGLFVGLLAACGAGTEETATDGAGGGTTTTVASACTTAPASFTGTVWKDMSASCTTCHAQGRVAGGSNLVFVAAGTEMQNYNILRNYAKDNGSLLLSKSVGMPAHAGGRPFTDTNSAQYKALAALVPEMAAQVCQTTVVTAPVGGAAGGGYWSGVQMAADTAVLRKASVMFAGRNPTAAESSAAAGSPAALRSTMRGYMQGPVFDRFLNDVGDTHFLTPGVVVRGNNTGYVAADWPTAGAVLGAANVTQVANAVRNRFDASARREPIELMKFIVKNERPYTDMVAGNYTVANGLLTQYLGATVQGTFTNVDDDNEWRQATLPSARLGGMREHAGVLSTHSWLQRMPTTPTNRNRHRVNVMFTQFLATDVSALAVRPIEDGNTNFKIPTVENPACAVCHDVIDPAAAGFQNWNEANRYLPQNTNNVNHALPANYRANNYPKDANNQSYYQAGDNWFRDGKAPGFGSTPMPGGFAGNPAALQWLGQQVAADSRFALGAVHFWYEGLFGRAPLKAPFDQASPQYAAMQAAYTAQNDEFKAIASRFATNQGNGAYNVKDLLIDLMTSRWSRADRVTALNTTRALELHDVGSLNMLPPSQLNQKLIGLVGQGWNEFDNPYTGMALSYGDFDGNQRVNRAKSHTMMQSIAIDRLVAVRSCTFTQADFNKPMADRLLFPAVTLADLPSAPAGLEAITQNVRHLHKALWKEDVPATDAEVQRTVKLFTDIWADRATAPARPVNCAYTNNNDANYTGRAWAAVLAYMLGDPKFLYE